MEQKDFHGMRLLAQSIRRRIMDVVHKNGGHLASNLGIVELMVALHKTFHFPDDKLLFDVSHQCYAHKLLSGRDGDAFDLLRKDGGLCGFCNPSESPWDIFHVGHAGTALSSALGLAASRDRRKGNEHIIALLGDGSLTCGLTWEAMQWVRQTTERLIIIINDNGFSIDPTGGAIGAHLEKLRHGKVAAKNSLFQHMGMDYHGPIDGHCLENLVDSLEYARTKACPQVIHVVTKKGYGDRDAEMFPADFHGICGKERQKEEIFSDSLSYYGELCGRALCQLAEMDERIVAITAAMRIGTGLSPFAEKFPERFFDVGIGESHAVTFAAAM
ncbi:MAG: 1-deoxy-D-xylulose-5-phosphate synthase, partial [Puniceicoccales bacterium]|nr:1-deoxy-D-xylulose-5-phosphate synthase [Puniceicoccales bacterium]